MKKRRAIPGAILVSLLFAGCAPAGDLRNKPVPPARPAPSPDGIPRVPLLLSFYDDFHRGADWTPPRVIQLLESNPGAYLYVGNYDVTLPIGSPVRAYVRSRVDEWQRAIRHHNRGAAIPLDEGRLCVDWRPDLVFKHVDGAQPGDHCGRMFGKPQCSADCTRDRGNPCTRWEGDMRKDWGPVGEFQRRWLLGVSGATWDTTVDRHYRGVDFCAQFASWGMADRFSICALRTPAWAPALYGWASKDRPELAAVSGVGLDIRQRDARAWNAMRLLSHLKSLGFDPGERGCVLVGYKPGMWAREDGAVRGRDCPAQGANTWSGFVTPQNAGRCPAPRPLLPTPYGPGQYEAALNAQMRAAYRALDGPLPAAFGAAKATYSGIRLLFTERPMAGERLWSIWEDDVRRDPRVLGEMTNRPTGLR
ncbi:MAG: hypothetical protein SFX73_08095 [Kofleriaceae bacterium]|nr:hypothetical protein [Kofleriaceae bacterium]